MTIQTITLGYVPMPQQRPAFCGNGAYSYSPLQEKIHAASY
ncbi:MAG: hypothetical protein AB8B99_23000 [Phormidesmis sp.]